MLASQARNLTKRNLSLLMLVFLIGFGGQAILNFSVGNFISDLDKKVSNADIQKALGQEVILKIHHMESQFFQLSAFPNKHMRRILSEEILKDQNRITQALRILNQGGTFYHSYDLNLPNTEALKERFTYVPMEKEHFSFARTDTVPKLKFINQSLLELTKDLNELDQYRRNKSPELADKISEFKLKLKFISPVFHRLKENANNIFYQNKVDYQALQLEVAQTKADYQELQTALALFLVLFGILAFWRLAHNINTATHEMQMSQDYTHDILNSQSNIIVVNDGKRIIDVSGGFFSYFDDFKSVEDFSKHFDCICDMFVEEEGYIYKFNDHNWVEYLLEHQNQPHKVKINYKGKVNTFQISAVKSKKYQRFIISMFDISDNERINQDLAIEKDKALAATKAKGDFLANMSHEIRTPLNAILGFINLLKDKQFDNETTRYLNTIDNSGQSLLGIINDILDFSKIESGKLEIDLVEFDPKREFTTTADLFRAKCSEKNISFVIDLDKNLPHIVKSDSLRIKQVVSNLLSNAIKFSPDNQRIELKIEYHTNPDCLKLSVTDHGIGISPEQQQHIFEAFSQAENSTTRKYGGTGLGLAISSKLVQMLGGKLQLSSTIGEGSCFYFNIPVKVIDGAPMKEEEKPSQITQFSGHILLVEDNLTNQLLMSAILKKQGLSFDIANDGLEAIKAVEHTPYDLVLMDENMPNLNGIEATKQIRKLGETFQTLPIIALTANAMTGDRERFIAAGMDEYLSKPINMIELQRILQQYLTD